MDAPDARARILGALRRHPIPPQTLPNHEGPWTEPNDLRAAFCASAERAGATIVDADRGDLAVALAPTLARLAPRNIVSLVPELAISTRSPNVVDPHDYADCDLAIVRGEFGVAENGAIWITDRAVPERSLWFLCEHLVVLLDPTELVPHMHAAYARLGSLDAAFGMFLSGPSKTADIEQALVIGAHGARSMLVVFLT